jgi:hypothetical protein
MRKQVIIAKYNEDITWVKDLECPVIIYDKFQDKDLPNVGRDLHTYAHHIATHYDHLADTTFFLQGNPFDHYKDAILEVNKHKTTNFLPLTDIYRLTHKTGVPYFPNLPLENVYQELTGKPLPDLVKFISGAQFAASRQQIHKHPQTTYARMSAMATEIEQYPHVFERLIGILIGGERKWGVNKQSPIFLEYIKLMNQNMNDGNLDLIILPPW